MTETLKRRIVRLSAVKPEEYAEIWSALRRVEGVRSVEAQSAEAFIVEYDLVRTSLLQIEEAIESNGGRIKPGLFSRFKRAFIHYTEQNELDNATAPASPCCSNPKFCAYSERHRKVHPHD